MKRRLVPAIMVLALVVAGATPALALDALVVQGVSADSYPTVDLDLVVPAGLLTAGDVTFDVRENGEPVDGVEWKRAPVDEYPSDVILVVDTSGSMKGEALDSAKRAAEAFVAELQAGSRAAVLSFSTETQVVSGFTDDEAALTGAIGSLAAAGETALYDSLAVAADLATDAARKTSVVLLSDGGDTRSRGTLDAGVKSLRAKGIPVFVVSLPSDEADPASLQAIADQTGGRLYNVASLDDLVGYYRGLAKELQTHYLVSYESLEPLTKDLDIVVVATNGQASAEGVAFLENPLFLQSSDAGTGLTAIPAANALAYGAAVVLAFAAVALLVGAVAMLVFAPRAHLGQLQFYDQLKGGIGDLPDADSADPNSLRSRILGTVEEVAGKRGLVRLVYQSLERAGLPLRPTEYMVGHFTIVLVAGLAAGLLSRSLGLSMLAVVFATAVPMIWIRQRADSRRKSFEEQLPDILSLIAGSLRAGWGMLQSIELVTREMRPPVSDEFRRVETETRLGLPLEESLRSMAERIESDDLRWAVSAIAIQREVGGNLAEVLDIIARTIRERAALKRQVRTLTAEGRLSAYILVALPFFEFLVLFAVNRSYIMLLLTTGPGVLMLLMGLVLIVVGSVWLRAATSVEV